MYAVITREPGGTWRLLAGPFMYPQEAHDVANRALRTIPPGEALVATCPWDTGQLQHENIEQARTSGAIERVTL